MLRYFAVRRSDPSFWYQLGTFALVPLALPWPSTVLRANRWYSKATCLNPGWQIRPESATDTRHPPRLAAPGQLLNHDHSSQLRTLLFLPRGRGVIGSVLHPSGAPLGGWLS
jgi:hypothetical protein